MEMDLPVVGIRDHSAWQWETEPSEHRAAPVAKLWAAQGWGAALLDRCSLHCHARRAGRSGAVE